MAKTKRNHRPTSSVTFQQARGAKTVEVPQGLVVYLKESELHYLNPTAATVFLLCATPLTESQVAAVLHEEYALNDPPHRRGKALPCGTRGSKSHRIGRR